jgi:hypothetical protein
MKEKKKSTKHKKILPKTHGLIPVAKFAKISSEASSPRI